MNGLRVLQFDPSTGEKNPSTTSAAVVPCTPFDRGEIKLGVDI